jgi:hypothetical protein
MARAIKLYWSPNRQDNHTVISAASEAASIGSGYHFVRIEGYAFESSKPNTVPLKAYWHAGRGDNGLVATEDGNRDHRGSGYSFVRDEGYVLKNEEPNTVPLKLFWNSQRGDNFTTSSPVGEKSALDAGYRFIRVEGWVSPLPVDLTVNLRSDLGANHYMTTKGVMLQNGHIDAETKTQTGTMFGGFTGGVQLFLADANDLTIGASSIRTFGVDGTAIGRSTRLDYWSENIPIDVASRATSIHVVHFWSPKYDAILNIGRKALEASRPIIQLINEIKGIGGDGK